MSNKNYDAIVIGSGPNGLAAAITLQRNGLSVLLLEGKDSIGGGMRTSQLTLPGFQHDICSAVHPMAVSSPFFKTIPFEKLGLQFIYPQIDAAHPFDNGKAATLHHSIDRTVESLGADGKKYKKLINPLLEIWPEIIEDALGPLKFPKKPLSMARFGKLAIQPATILANKFKTDEGRGLWAGMAAHSIQPLSNMATSAIGLVLMTTAHLYGWPLAKGGSQSLANALGNYFKTIGGHIETGTFIRSIEDLPASKAILLDITPKQLLEMEGLDLPASYARQLRNYRYGMGVFKMDWALKAPIAFTNEDCQKAGTVHLGSTFEEIATSELNTSRGTNPTKPFILLSQPTVFDKSRAPAGKHIAWAYCHVPNGSTQNLTTVIENQIERYAPGFKNIILQRSTINTEQLEQYNPNYIGGDINGGILDIRQLYTRPVLSLSPYRTRAKGVYLCSSSTPPGGGVHGMCGYHAALQCLKDVF